MEIPTRVFSLQSLLPNPNIHRAQLSLHQDARIDCFAHGQCHHHLGRSPQRLQRARDHVI